MGLKTFLGGVHPYEGKELAKDAPIKEILPKGELVFPVSLEHQLLQLLPKEILYLRDRKLLKLVDLFHHQFILQYQEL